MLNEGLYEQVISKALSSELENPEQIVDTNKIDNADQIRLNKKHFSKARSSMIPCQKKCFLFLEIKLFFRF